MTTVDTVTGEILEPLTAMERSALTHAEAKIERGLASFVEVGAALAEVREARLYRDTYATFEAYCRDRWALSHRHVNRTIEASQIVTGLGPIGPVPATESQARELSGLDPEDAAEVMETAAEISDGKITAAVIREARETTFPAAVPAPFPKLDPAVLAAAGVSEFPDLAYYFDLGEYVDVINMAGDLRRYRERGELEMRLDNLRRSIAVDRADRDGSYRPGMTAVMGTDGEYRMEQMTAPESPTADTCPTCGQTVRN